MPQAGSPAAAPTRRPDWAGLGAAALIGAAAAAAYGRTFGVPFLYDDTGSIAGNASIRHWATALLPPPAETVGGRPVLNLSLALNYAAGGTEVWGYHAFNLLVHALAGLVLFGIVRRTLAGPDRDLVSFAAALAWVLHPLQTESVTYVIQRAESLMGLFYLLTVYCFVRYVGKGQTRTGPPSCVPRGGTSEGLPRVPPGGTNGSGQSVRAGWGWLAVVFCFLGVGTKEVMATAPIVVLLYDRTFLAGTFREAWARRWRIHAALAASWVPLAFLVLGTHGRGNTAGFGGAVPWWRYALAQFPAVVRYLRLSAWPHPLVFDYGTALDLSWRQVAPSAAVVILLAAATAWALARRPAAGFLGACFFIILAPSSSFIPVATEPVAEHRMYLPLAAICVAAAVAAARALGRRGAFLVVALAAAMGWATSVRNGVYASEADIWGDTLARRPGNERAHNNVGNVLGRQPGRSAEAIAQYEEALRLRPDYAEAHFNLGCELEKLPGRLNDAVAQYEEAVRLQPGFADAHNNLGGALARTPGREGEAMAHFEEAVRLRPGDARARGNLGAALMEAPGRLAEAIAQLEESLRLEPDNAQAHFNLAVALLRSGERTDEAAMHLRAALRLQPANDRARELLGRLGGG